MKKLKIMTILGTRPEIIRLSRVIATLDAYTDQIAGYHTAKVGESLAGWDFEHFWFV